jgi:SAM-dependent methyltransferase
VRQILKKLLPKAVKSALQDAGDFSADSLDRLLGRQDPLTPPRRLVRNVGGDFKRVGENILQYLVRFAKLQPHEAVLDVGCGCGRAAVPLTRYLNERGRYEGFDIDAQAVRWCVRNITPRCPGFHFQVADMYSKRYNPTGKYQASEYDFPYGEKSFDCVFLTSVFTHLLPEGMEKYFAEISRVMNDGGRCLITFFLLNAESRQFIEKGKSSLDFGHDFGKYRLVDPDVPEQAVAYEEAFVAGLYEKYGLQIQGPIRYGSWCGRPQAFDYQDIILAAKKGGATGDIRSANGLAWPGQRSTIAPEV